MLIPDVLALPLAEAIARLEAAGIGYTVAVTQPPRRQNEVLAEKIAVEYVVRQSLLSDNKVALVTVKKIQKGGAGEWHCQSIEKNVSVAVPALLPAP